MMIQSSSRKMMIQSSSRKMMIESQSKIKQLQTGTYLKVSKCLRRTPKCLFYRILLLEIDKHEKEIASEIAGNICKWNRLKTFK